MPNKVEENKHKSIKQREQLEGYEQDLWDLAKEIHEKVKTWPEEKQNCVDFFDQKVDKKK